MKTYTVTVAQYVEEVAEIEIVADTEEEARARVEAMIASNTLDDEVDLDWSDGDGTHADGVTIVSIA